VIGYYQVEQYYVNIGKGMKEGLLSMLREGMEALLCCLGFLQAQCADVKLVIDFIC